MPSEKQVYYKTKIFITSFIALSAILWLFYLYHQRKIEGIKSDIEICLSDSYKTERQFIENIPIYRDYATPAREQALRRYLLKEHIQAAEKYGIKPLLDESRLKESIKRGKLVSIDKSGGRLYYFHNVSKKYRYLTRGASEGLDLLTSRFQENLKRRAGLPEVKIAVSSAVRPIDYQKKLMARNINASYVSTHSYGTSFDIFYDDYFVSVPLKAASGKVSGEILNRLRTRLGYMMGDSLRRQLRSILMETLTELQEEGKLYAILERRQRCYHVTILN